MIYIVYVFVAILQDRWTNNKHKNSYNEHDQLIDNDHQTSQEDLKRKTFIFCLDENNNDLRCVNRQNSLEVDEEQLAEDIIHSIDSKNHNHNNSILI